MTTATEAQKEHRVIDRETYLNPPVPTGVDLTHVPLATGERAGQRVRRLLCDVAEAVRWAAVSTIS